MHAPAFSSPHRLRRRLPALLLLLVAAVLGACGGGGDKEDAREVVGKAFKKEIKSANLTLDAELKLDGLRQFTKPFEIHAKGPWRSMGDGLPAFDIDIDASAGPGQTVSTGRLSTGDRMFLKFEDSYYELSRKAVQATNKQLQQDAKQGKSLKGVGVNAREWLDQGKLEDDAEVGGVETRHVKGTLDIAKALKGLNDFASRAGPALGASGTQAPQQLPASVRKTIQQVVRNPRFDLYVGKDDVIRRLSANIAFTVPEKDRAQLQGLRGGSFKLSVEFRDVGGDQKIDPPAKARPISDLSKSLGGAGALGGLGGLTAPQQQPQAAPQQPAQPALPQTPAPAAPQTPAPGGGGAAAPSPEDYRRYGECLDKAGAADEQAIQDCAKEVQ